MLGANGALNNSTTFDSLTYNGRWNVPYNHPYNPFSMQGVLVSEFASSSYGYHIFKTSSASYIRHYFGGWSDKWLRFDNFGCNTPEDLASLLGVMGSKYYTTITPSSDLNDCRQGVFFYYTGATPIVFPVNTPISGLNAREFILESYKIYNTTVQKLHFIGETWLRYGYSTSNWSDWRKVQFAT